MEEQIVNRARFVQDILHEAKTAANSNWDNQVKVGYLDLLKFLVDYVKITKDEKVEVKDE